ncbi:MAG: hypothetical protein V9F04_02005 [Dermatophilaceae bacterium]
MAQGREVAQFHGVVAFDLVVLADGGEDFGLFDGVDAEVGFEVKVGVEQVGRVAGQTGDDLGHLRDDGVTRVGGRRSGVCRALGDTAAGGAAAARRGAGGLGEAGLGADPAGDVAQGGEVAQLHGVVAFDLVVLADGGEDFGLFDGVDAEVGFEVQGQRRAGPTGSP